MISLRTAAAAAAALILGALAPAAADAVTYPQNFEEQVVVEGLSDPTGMAWAPDGRLFIIEKDGKLKVAAPGARTATEILDLSGQINSYSDRGLLGLALDSAFATNGYVYLLYTNELRPMTADSPLQMTSRLDRIQVNSSNVVSGRTTILGTRDVNAGICPAPSNTVDCIPSNGTSHSIGSVRSAPDGTLWVGSGDAASFSEVDEFALGTYNTESMAGKIMHVDRNGGGVAGHPFCSTDTNLTHVCTKIWARGFRNPFRFKLRPGGLTVGDVGWATWEEVNLVPTGPGTGGRSYGWPCYEGVNPTSGYRDLSGCQAQYTPPNTHFGPVHQYEHTGENGSAVVGGPTYTGGPYPADYQNDVFFGDYAQGFVRRLNNGTGQVESFATGWSGVDLELTPAGELAYADIGGGAIKKVVYTGTPGNHAPTASFTATPLAGPAPLTVTFNGSGSSDPDRDPLSYRWDFDDGGTSNAVSPTHTFNAPGNYTVRLTVSDPGGETGVAEKAIGVGAPVPQVSGPARYQGGQEFVMHGSATDEQDGVLPPEALDWDVRVIHAGHQHFIGSYDNRSQLRLTGITDHDADSHYRIMLTATDSDGVSAQKVVQVHPLTTTLRLRSVPAGAPLSYGGRAVKAPANLVTAIGYRTTVTAGATFQIGSSLFDFASWSNGGARVQNITVSPAGGELVAQYRSRSGPGGPNPPGGGTTNPGAGDTLGPALRLLGVDPARGRIRGRATDKSGIDSVSVALRRKVRGGGCSWWLKGKRKMSAGRRPCAKPRWMKARLTATSSGVRWLLKLGRSLPPGNYRVLARATDGEGNRGKLPAGPNAIIRVPRR